MMGTTHPLDCTNLFPSPDAKDGFRWDKCGETCRNSPVRFAHETRIEAWQSLAARSFEKASWRCQNRSTSGLLVAEKPISVFFVGSPLRILKNTSVWVKEKYKKCPWKPWVFSLPIQRDAHSNRCHWVQVLRYCGAVGQGTQITRDRPLHRTLGFWPMWLEYKLISVEHV